MKDNVLKENVLEEAAQNTEKQLDSYSILIPSNLQYGISPS